MAINKVVFGNDTLIDLTEDSVSASNLLEGETAHDRSGNSVTGTAKQGHVIKNSSGTDLTQRAKLQFIGATVSDDSVGDKTVVNMPSATPKSTTAQFDTVNGGVLDKCLVELDPVQDLHGYDYPWVGGAGKNLFKVSVDTIKSVNTNGTWSGNAFTPTGQSITFTILTDSNGNVNGIKANGTTSSQTPFYLTKPTGLPSGSYILTGGLSSDKRLFLYNGSRWFNDLGSGVSFEITGSETQQTPAIAILGGQTCNNDIFYPMIRLATETDDTFEPYSNICPISGHTEVDVERVGKNFSSVTNETFTYQKTINDYIPAGTYRASGIITTDATNDPVIIFYDADNNDIGRFWFTPNTGVRVDSGAKLILAKDAVKYILQSGNTIATSTTKTATFKDIQIEKGETTTSFEPHQLLSVQIPLGDTYYGGTLDVVSGELVVKYGTIDLGTCNWLPQSTPGRFDSTTTATLKKPGDTNIKCSIYRTVTVSEMGDGCIRGSNSNGNIVILDSRFANYSGEQVKTALNGVQLVYELATPVTVQLTPQQVTALVGQNNISAPLTGQAITDAVYKELFTFDDIQQNVVIPASRVTHESVSVTADGVKTYATLLNELWALIDTNKVMAETKLQIGGDWFSLVYCNQNTVVFVQPYFDTSNGKSKSLQIVIRTASTYYEQNGDGQTPTNLSNNTPTSGTKITIYY